MKYYKIPYKNFEKFIFSGEIEKKEGQEHFFYKKNNFNSFLKKGTYSSELENNIFKKASNIYYNRPEQAETITISSDPETDINNSKMNFELAQIIAFDNLKNKPQYVIIESKLAPELLEKILKTKPQDLGLDDKVSNISLEKPINWDIAELAAKESWDDLEYCIKKLSSSNEVKEIAIIMQSIEKDIFKQEEFYNQLLNNFYNQSITDILDFSYVVKEGENTRYPMQNDTFVNYITGLIQNLNTETTPGKKLDIIQKILISLNTNEDGFLSSNNDYIDKDTNDKSSEWIERTIINIQKNALDSTTKVVDFISKFVNIKSNRKSYNTLDKGTSKLDTFSMFKHLIKPNIINDIEFLKFLDKEEYSNDFYKRFNLDKDLDKNIYHNKEGIKKLLESCPNLIINHSSSSREFFQPIVSQLSKEEICDIIKSVNSVFLMKNFPMFCGLFKEFNKEFMSKEVFKTLMESTQDISIQFASYVSEIKEFEKIKKYMQDPEIVAIALKNNQIEAISLMSFDAIKEIKDSKIISQILEKNNHIWLENQTSIPKEWFESNEIMNSMISNLRYFSLSNNKGLSKEFMQGLFSRKENLIIAAKQNLDIFSKIVHKLNIETDMDVLCSFLDAQNINKYEVQAIFEKLPTSIWSNHEFCLSALQSSEKYTSKIDKDIFQDHMFLKKLFSKIDDRLISDKVLIEIDHKILSYIKAANIQVGDYEQFFNKTLNKQKLQDNLIVKEDIKVIRKKI